MALLFMDGFDHYNTADLGKKWDFATSNALISSGNGANGTNALYFSDDNDFQQVYKAFANSATIIAGVRCKPIAAPNNTNQGFLHFRDSGTTQIRLWHGTDGSISVYRGTTLLGTSAINVMPANVYTYIEAKVFISSTVGTVEVRANGATVINLTGQNTQNTANAFINQVRLAGFAGSANSWMDDFYVCDTTGTVANNFLGDVVVKTLRPTGAGTNTQFTPSTGANWENVDDTLQDGDATYNASGTLNHRDTYAMSDLPALGAAVYGVQVTAFARKEGSVTRGIKPTLKSGATYSLGTEVILASTDYSGRTATYTLNPNGSVQWTETTVNAIEAGVDVST